MFSTLIVRAQRVSLGDIIKIAGKKRAVEAIVTFPDGSIQFSFAADKKTNRKIILSVEKNEPIKIHSK